MPDPAVANRPSGPVLPALIAGAGDRAALRFVEQCTVNIRNKEHAGGLCAGCCRLSELV